MQMRDLQAWSPSMISHLSISVPDPERAARIIADLWRGEAMAMPPHDGVWIACSGDDEDTAIEAHALPDAQDEDAPLRRIARRVARPAPTHVVLASPLTQKQIEAIARREHALPRISEHGPLRRIEFWIEDWLRLEVVTFALRVDVRRDPGAPAQRSVFELTADEAREEVG